jgi:integrase
VPRPATESGGIKGVTFQSLPRALATHFHRVGTVKDQQAQMRHADAQTTMNTQMNNSLPSISLLAPLSYRIDYAVRELDHASLPVRRSQLAVKIFRYERGR